MRLAAIFCLMSDCFNVKMAGLQINGVNWVAFRSKIKEISVVLCLAAIGQIPLVGVHEPLFATTAETSESTAKITEIQRALSEFGFYKGRIDGKIRRSLYDAMSRYSTYVRSKGWSDATGELTEDEIVFLLRQYDKRIAAASESKATSQTGGVSGSGATSGSSASSSANASSGTEGGTGTGGTDAGSSSSSGNGSTAGSSDYGNANETTSSGAGDSSASGGTSGSGYSGAGGNTNNRWN